jgi:hypothetical protein
VPVPDNPMGLIVQMPVAGRPFSTTLPVVAVHEEGCVIVPTIGSAGAVGGTLMTTSADACEIHPASTQTVKEYVPGARFVIVVVVPVPEAPAGSMVHTPVAGSPERTTLPVVAVHEAGWVIVPITGSVGAEGAGAIITFADATDKQPAAVLTVKLYVPGLRLKIVVEVPVPVIAPGLIVQVPLAGRPLRTTLPYGAEHDAGWVMVPTIGALGGAGGVLIVNSAERSDIQPAALVTLKL